jgi:hypothetical protein
MFVSPHPENGGGAITGADGTFRAAVRWPGEYHVYAAGDDVQMDSDFLDAHEKDFPVVHVLDGTNPPLVLRLPAK